MYDMISLDVDGANMPAMVCGPEGDEPHPVLVVAMHMPAHAGLEGTQFAENMIQLFAHSGYLCVVPFIFQRFPLKKDRQEKRASFDDKEIHADQETAYQWLISNENVDSDSIGIYSNDDGNPSPEDADAEEQALIAAGIEYEFHRYDGAGHAFMNPTSSRDPDPYRYQASEDSRNKQLAFLARHL